MEEFNNIPKFSLIKWQSIWICFILSCWSRFVAIDIANLLLVYSKVDCEWLISRSCKAYKSHWISQVVVARARYSASADDRIIVTCFFDFYEINELPRKIVKPMTILPENHFNWNFDEDEKKRPCAGVAFRYLNTRVAAWWWLIACLARNCQRTCT